MAKEMGDHERRQREMREEKYEKERKRQKLERQRVDTSDIPEAGEEFFKKAKLVQPKKAKKK
jgi:hypothetical protein